MSEAIEPWDLRSLRRSHAPSARRRRSPETSPRRVGTTGISRNWFYKWQRRYREEGIDGLRDRPSGPHDSPTVTETTSSTGSSTCGATITSARKRSRCTSCGTTTSTSPPRPSTASCGGWA
ncbi:helix-turn-helix domain-containing protein [Actinomadura coerulea]|uniref:helix-turn-helix domain-containing protein n=1 Tax=Actinomadura coerulea TaxID=46159 RepID=UPI003F4E1E67